VAAAYRLYTTPGGNQGQRRWGPWFGYTLGWATFPAWWVWRQDAEHHPVGPWAKTGRYVQRAIPAIPNYHLVIAKDWSTDTALTFARKLATHFKVEGDLYVSAKGLVTWTNTPPKPSLPPANGVGPRPKPNAGL
jgi:hypothetical protein